VKKAPPEHEIIVALDSEWVVRTYNRGRCETRKRCALSYQLVLRNETLGLEHKWFVRCESGRRYSLRWLLSQIIQRAKCADVVIGIPRSIVLGAHFTRADLTILSDIEDFKRQLSGVRGTYTTTAQPFSHTLSSPAGEFRVFIRVLDTMLLSANGSALEDVGEMIGIPKVELPPPYSKDRMDLFLAKDPRLFKSYAMTDAIIVARFIPQLRKLARERLNVGRPFCTLGALAVSYFMEVLKKLKISKNRLLGRDEHGEMLPNVRALIEGDAPSAFHGGYNSPHIYGVSPLGAGVVIDFDLKGAYLTTMRMLRVPDWSTTRYTLDLDELTVVDEALVVASVEFEFPSETKFPCLTERCSSYGLIYPLKGISFCTGAEITVARSLGAKLKVKSGWRVEWDATLQNPFHAFAMTLAKLRAEAEERGDVVAAKTFKECSLSLYGKIGQGVTVKRPRSDEDDELEKLVFDTKTGEPKLLDPSAVTCAPFAAFITGMCRTAMFEMLNSLPPGVTALVTTTDGSALHCPDRSFMPDQSGPVAQAFLHSRAAMAPGPPAMWEIKAIVDSILVIKTRMNVTRTPGRHLIKGKPSPAILAHVGSRLSNPPEDEFEHSALWVAHFRTRNYETRFETTRLTGIREQHNDHADLLDFKVMLRWNADPDLKVRPVNVRDYDGLFRADGAPWRTKDEARQMREAFDSWRKDNRRVVRTARDWADFQEWLAAREARRSLKTNARAKTPLLVRAFVIALLFRLTAVRYRSYRRIVDFVRQCGVPITIMSIQNIKRRFANPDDALHCIEHPTSVEIAFACEAMRRTPKCEALIRAVTTAEAYARVEEFLREPILDPTIT
jgi:hypothetical protein